MDEPLFNELLESVKQADQIMTDHAELQRLAKAATPGEWSAVWEEGDDTAWPNLFPIIQAENGETVIGNEGFYSDLEQDKANAQFCAAANPKTILALLDEIDRLKAENEALRGALHAVQAEVDGNLRPLTRDLVNMVSGLNNGTHPNDIYDHCDEIERIIGAALEGAKP
ncbi:ead/Ea22-like family protein [Pseudomonas aeruginosa]|uniref:ead/Ea22-like family protein n=1 Tax=Pseudomonas aeruginosa TaxID=287 RepID=UPI001CD29818|nr:ead/Ea22-like family protein [Pseudomonas aeruginosa]